MAATVDTAFNGTSSLSGVECLRIIRQKLGTTKFQILKTEVSPFSATPSGFFGDHYRLKVTVQLLEQTEPLEISFFVKCMPNNENEELNFVSTMGAFRKEYGILKFLVKELAQCDDRSVDSPSWMCECFLARQDAIVLEDLTVDGFRCCNSSATLDFQHATLTLQTLAKFHAASVILEEKTGGNCRLDETYRDLFFETIFVDEPDHPGRKICVTGIKSMQTLLSHMPKYDERSEHHELIKERLEEIGLAAFDFAKPSGKYRNVVSHGDLWVNNLLFRYDEAGGDPVDCRLIDFQLVRYTPPANDVMCFVMLTLSRKLRDSHLEELLAIYHRSLQGELSSHGLDIASLFPWDEFRESCDCYHILGRIMACYYMPTCTLKPDKITNVFRSPEAYCHYMLVDRDAVNVESFLSDSTYRERIVSVMEELIETCILNGL